jgi:hypothetical protein
MGVILPDIHLAARAIIEGVDRAVVVVFAFLILTVSGVAVFYRFADRRPSAPNQTFHWVSILTLNDADFTVHNGKAYFQGVPFPQGTEVRSLVIAVATTGLPTPYSKDTNRVYYVVAQPIGMENVEVVPGADPQVFQVIYDVGGPGEPDGGAFGKDSDNVFIGTAPITGADPATFVVLPSVQSCGPTCEYRSEDKNHLYYYTETVR